MVDDVESKRRHRRRRRDAAFFDRAVATQDRMFFGND
jgi:hypothetical protein